MEPDMDINGDRAELVPEIPAGSKALRKLNTFECVFVLVCLAMFGAILFLRLGFILGDAGLIWTLGQMFIAYTLLIFTILSISAIATGLLLGAIEGGVIYFMTSRLLFFEPKNKEQFSRSISYAEWRKIKLQSRMPQDTTGPISSTSNGPAAMVSTVSYKQDLPESGLSSRNGMPAPKRLEPDTLPASRLSDVIRRKPKEMSSWTVKDVVELLDTEEDLVRFKDLFVEEEIDGKAFDLLTTDILQRMGIKMGPLMKIKDLLEKVRIERAVIDSN